MIWQVLFLHVLLWLFIIMLVLFDIVILSIVILKIVVLYFFMISNISPRSILPHAYHLVYGEFIAFNQTGCHVVACAYAYANLHPIEITPRMTCQ